MHLFLIPVKCIFTDMTKEIDTNKIDEMIEELIKNSQDNIISKTFYKTVEFAKEILELSERSDYIKGKIEVDNILGKVYFHICDYENAQMYFLRSLKEAEKSNDNKGMSFALNKYFYVSSGCVAHPTS